MPVAQDPPCVLVADDDAISQRFFAAALNEMGCDVVVVPCGSAVLDATDRRHFDLLLLDCRMPDLGGTALLDELRKRDVQTTAIATTAEIDPNDVAPLRAAGFSACLTKPITVEQLHQALRAYLPDMPAPSSATGSESRDATVLDDSRALETSGNPVIVKSLRALFATELEGFLAEPVESTGQYDLAMLGDRLHRLRASCGFCGASMLANAAIEFENALRGDRVPTRAAHRQFEAACKKTLEALRSQL